MVGNRKPLGTSLENWSASLDAAQWFTVSAGEGVTQGGDSRTHGGDFFRVWMLWGCHIFHCTCAASLCSARKLEIYGSTQQKIPLILQTLE